MSVILISRFMLDLQAARHATCDSLPTSLDQSQHSVLFARIMGSLDASIVPEDTVNAGDDITATPENTDEDLSI